MIYNSNKD